MNKTRRSPCGSEPQTFDIELADLDLAEEDLVEVLGNEHEAEVLEAEPAAPTGAIHVEFPGRATISVENGAGAWPAPTGATFAFETRTKFRWNSVRDLSASIRDSSATTL